MTPLHIVYALIVTACWGGNFVAAKVGLEYFPTYLLLALRFALVAAMLLPFFWRRTIPLGFLLVMSVVLGTGHFALVYEGIAHGLDISTSVITVQLGVPFSCLLSAMFFNDRLGAWRTMGMVVAFVGVMMIAGTPNVVDHFVPFLITMAGAMCWAVTNVLLKRRGSINILELLGWMSLFSVPQLLLLSFLFEEGQWELVRAAPLIPVAAVAFSAIGSTVVAYGLWYYLLLRHDVSKVAPYNLLVPVFAVASAYFMLGEELTLPVLMGGAMTIVGVAIIVLRKPPLSVLGRISRRKETS